MPGNQIVQQTECFEHVHKKPKTNAKSSFALWKLMHLNVLLTPFSLNHFSIESIEEIIYARWQL